MNQKIQIKKQIKADGETTSLVGSPTTLQPSSTELALAVSPVSSFLIQRMVGEMTAEERFSDDGPNYDQDDQDDQETLSEELCVACGCAIHSGEGRYRLNSTTTYCESCWYTVNSSC